MQHKWIQEDNELSETARDLELGVSEFNNFYAEMLRQLKDQDKLRSDNLETLR